jgi:surface antigen
MGSLKNLFFKILKGIFKSPLFYFLLIFLISLIFEGKAKEKFEVFKENFSYSFYFSQSFQPEFPELVLIGKNTIQSLPSAFISPKTFSTLIGEEKKEIIEYIVEKGDSLWSISKEFGISIETIVWANDLENLLIKPGQRLLILPVSGVIHIVSEGETISQISKKYKADPEEIVSFNEISEDEIFPGQLLIVPGGKMPFVQKIEPKISSTLSTNNFYGKSHTYPYGQCTWWVAQKRPIPSFGNAREWLEKAILMGYSVCKGSYCQPQIGAVISVKTKNPLGHVGYVERVEDGKVTFSEMNYIGWGKVNYRSLRIGDPRILGYIY